MTATSIQMMTPASATLPKTLQARLSRAQSPSKSPTELAAALEKQLARTTLLRSAHVEAVRDRAAREAQRVLDAEARRRRLGTRAIDKVQRKLEEAEAKTRAKKEEQEAKRQALSAHRTELAYNVAAARDRHQAELAWRGTELREAEQRAAAKHAKLVQAVHDKSARNVKHALDVREAHEEKERLAAEEAGERLAERLNAAESRRSTLQTTPTKAERLNAAETTPSCAHPQLAKVLNEAKVNSERKASAIAAKMETAISKREALLQAVASKAGSLNLRAADKAAAAQQVAQGTDSATVASKAAHYDKLMRVEVARQAHLKQRGAACRFRGETTSVIIVRFDKARPTMPPTDLVKRLSTVSTSLLRTAKARQLGAQARRQAIHAAKMLKSALSNGKRAAALSRTSAQEAAVEAKVRAKAKAALCNKALQDGRKAAVVWQERARTVKAAKSRKEATALLASAGAEEAARCAAAADRREAQLRKVAKKGVLAVRASAVKSRRDAALSAVQTRGMELKARLMRVTVARAAHLLERVAKAKRSQAIGALGAAGSAVTNKKAEKVEEIEGKDYSDC